METIIWLRRFKNTDNKIDFWCSYLLRVLLNSNFTASDIYGPDFSCGSLNCSACSSGIPSFSESGELIIHVTSFVGNFWQVSMYRNTEVFSRSSSISPFIPYRLFSPPASFFSEVSYPSVFPAAFYPPDSSFPSEISFPSGVSLFSSVIWYQKGLTKVLTNSIYLHMSCATTISARMKWASKIKKDVGDLERVASLFQDRT